MDGDEAGNVDNELAIDAHEFAGIEAGYDG